MVHIVDFQTKKALKEAILNGDSVFIENPSPLGGIESGYLKDILSIGSSIVVTNHPKRSYFAQIVKTEGGFKVK